MNARQVDKFRSAIKRDHPNWLERETKAAYSAARWGYSAACQDEAEHTSAMLMEVVQIIEGSAPAQLPITPENSEAWTDWATTVLKNIGVMRLWCEKKGE